MRRRKLSKLAARLIEALRLTTRRTCRQDAMTEAEIHAFGIEIVLDHIQERGFVPSEVRTELGNGPQIVAQKDGRRCFIVVRTALYPEKGQLSNREAQDLIVLSDRNRATCHFASVGIARADAETEEERSTPVRSGGMQVSFEGLLILTDARRVKIWDSSGLRPLLEDD